MTEFAVLAHFLSLCLGSCLRYSSMTYVPSSRVVHACTARHGFKLRLQRTAEDLLAI